jgi:uncharacterized protein (TIGR02266 family)
MVPDQQRSFVPRPVRVSVPVRVDFEGDRFTIREFTANLSEGGIFLRTEHMVPPGRRGRLTFRLTQWDRPFTVEAEVVRVEMPDQGPDGPAPGLGIRFINLSPQDLAKIRRLVDGIRDGSVVEAIRRTVRESPKGLVQELRNIPTDQKLMLSIAANKEEIQALIRDGHSTVMLRLLENPRLTVPHVRAIVRDTRMETRVMLEIRKHQKWMSDEEVRYWFCRNPRSPFHEVQPLLPTLSIPHLQHMARDANVRPQVRTAAREAVSKRR